MRLTSNVPLLPRGALPLSLALVLAFAGCVGPDAAEGTSAASADDAASPDVDVETAASPSVVGAPHLHDYWSGRERVTLLDADFTVDPPTALMWGVQTTRVLGETAFGGAFVSFPEGAIVYEGTGRMEITVTWSDTSITGVRFLHRHAGSGEVQAWTETPNAEVVVLEVAPDMTDMPHAQSSRWGFLMAASGTPAVAVGTFHVRVEIVKTRDVAEWPAHPDLWEGETTITLVDAEGSAEGDVGPVAFVSEDPWAVPEDALVAERLVPMEAGTLRVTVTLLELDDKLPVERPTLLVRTTANLAFGFWDQGEPAEAATDGKTWTWERPIEMDETDNPYATASAWGFRVVAGAVDAPLPGCDAGCYEAALRYHLTAVVQKADEGNGGVAPAS